MFEIQVFHARVVAERHLDLELHSNWAARGPVDVPKGEGSSERVLYEMLEPSYGLGSGWEVAAHLQQAIVPSGRVVWGGTKLRLMHLFSDEESTASWHFAVNVEGGYQPARFDAARWGIEVRPVLEWSHAVWDIDFNPILATPFTGDTAGIPELNPALSLRFLLGDLLQPSIEGYAETGAVTRWGRPGGRRFYVFETCDVVRWPQWIIHAGVGEGLTRSSSGLIVTTIVGRIF